MRTSGQYITKLWKVSDCYGKCPIGGEGSLGSLRTVQCLEGVQSSHGADLDGGWADTGRKSWACNPPSVMSRAVFNGFRVRAAENRQSTANDLTRSAPGGSARFLCSPSPADLRSSNDPGSGSAEHRERSAQSVDFVLGDRSGNSACSSLVVSPRVHSLKSPMTMRGPLKSGCASISCRLEPRSGAAAPYSRCPDAH